MVPSILGVVDLVEVCVWPSFAEHLLGKPGDCSGGFETPCPRGVKGFALLNGI